MRNEIKVVVQLMPSGEENTVQFSRLATGKVILEALKEHGG